MTSKNEVSKFSIQRTVDIKGPKATIEEEIYNIQEDSALIQYEMNMIELPFFTRDKNIGKAVGKKYIFSKDQYMEVIPSATKESGYKIPQEFDEKIFYSIMQLYRKQGRRKIITTIYEILKLAGYGDNRKEYVRVKESLDRLKGTAYIFSGIFYDKEKNIRVKDRVNETILQGAAIREITELNEEDRKLFGRDTSKKSVVIITLSDFIENNIKSKGFLYYDSDKLIEVTNSTSRKLYLLTSKWQGWEKKKEIRRSCSFLASRIPLSWDKRNIPGTINVLEKAAKDLVEKGLIGDYLLERNKPLSGSYLTFNFEGAENTAKAKAIRRENENLSTETGQENFMIGTIENNTEHNTKDKRQMNLFGEPDEITEQTRTLREKAETAYKALNEEELEEYKQKAKNIAYYKLNLTQRVENKEITKEEAFRKAIIIIMSKELEEKSKEELENRTVGKSV